MLTAKIIQTWLQVRGTGIIDEHAISSLARNDADVAEAWQKSLLIDDLIGSAKLVKDGLASQSFAAELRNRLARETDGPDAVAAIWNAPPPIT